MQITHVGHSTVLLETGGARLLVDPGAFTPGWEELRGLDAVLVTHEHADHLDADRLPTLLQANPGVRVVAEPSVARSLRSGAAPDAHDLAPDATMTFGPVTVTATGGRHAVIHPDIPLVGNVGLVFAAEGEPTVYHPGDMYEPAPQRIDVLAVPISAPWAAARETVDFVRAVGAPVAFPIHEALLAPSGRGLYQQLVRQLVPGTELRDLAGKGATELG